MLERDHNINIPCAESEQKEAGPLERILFFHKKAILVLPFSSAKVRVENYWTLRRGVPIRDSSGPSDPSIRWWKSVYIEAPKTGTKPNPLV